MPIIRDRYSDNWPELALTLKVAAGWRCSWCDRPCRRTGESLSDFLLRIEGDFSQELDWINKTAVLTVCAAPGRFVLTVAHLDQIPANDDPANLAALCAPCHLRHNTPHRQANRLRKREYYGQIPLRIGALH